MSSSLPALSSLDLANVTGGAGSQSFDSYTKDLRDTMQKSYKSLVCDGAGFKGGGEFASKVYGDAATDADKIRASQMIRAYCNAGSQLPAAAPKFPF